MFAFKGNDLGNKRTILIAEDELINREILKTILADEYQFLEAENGKKALSLLSEHRDNVSLVLLDLNMPEMSGLEVLKEIEDNPSLNEIPVIVMTGDKKEEVECLDIGASDFISKPYPEAGIILARVKRVIELYEDRKIINYAERDTLTKLFTKPFFYEYAIDFDTHHKDKETDAIVIGIRSFHMIKERFGPDFSNNLLLDFALRLKKMMPSINGMVCHLEEDSFIVYCAHIDDYSKFLNQLANDFYSDKEKQTPINLQMGVYQNVDKGVDIDVRFLRARMALERIKNSAIVNISIYDSKLKEKALFEEQLIDEFPTAIKEKQFVVYYQPKYNIKGNKPCLNSAEALVRWIHPKLGMISPGNFIPLFEENGLIQLLDLYVWQEAARQIKEWKEKFHKVIPVSVNVSRIDLYNPQLLDVLKDIVSTNGLENKDLLLEITESACIEEAGNIVGKVETLRKEGFKIEIDDFGTGYSSLSMISKIPTDALKIDMIFVRNAFATENDNKMIKIILDIASYLNVPTIAEGVETEEQVKALKELGCDIVQGYYFSKPVPALEFERFIKDAK